MDGRTLSEKIQDRWDERRIEKYLKEAKEEQQKQERQYQPPARPALLNRL